ncbi:MULTISPECIES: glycerophosphodiester phosphodiesterase [Flavobacterium]|uniref:Glycerophosphodiester phosphodiesterase family protein n=1 Tax=Flavobacterium algoritolerans TaxID=3041254 RepID=A0ABT6VB62_9FLAO|nr:MULTISPECIES: glycerophosphodiester phosphodiesterase family protein [Flavobacterium]MDI5887292.1 glycerophosphodiester phosphodiesterase family protein [Flavobacterium yafengii]MDI5895483.1 glycerophosphodiester phosphodiesterase family protein [Flavobacterium algoritolerans]
MKFTTLLMASLIALLFSNCTSNKFIVCGHRGAMGYATENTLASIEKAIELKADMLEIDVFKIKTGEMVVFHDDDLDRITNAKGKIEEYTFDELRKVLVAGKHQIPTLQEVIETIDKKVVLNIELKGTNTATDTYRIIEEYKKKGWRNKDFFISSFRVGELQKMRSLSTEIAIGLLTYKDPIETIIKTAKELKAQAINPYYKTLTAENVAVMKANDFKIYPWTVNETVDIKNLQGLKVSGIITDYPDRIIR